MNVYDFDGTILHGDTEDYFLEYALKNFKIKFRHRIKLKFFRTLFRLKIIDEPHYRSHMYCYTPYIKNLDEKLKEFWDIHEKDIYSHYYRLHKDDDVVISATPRFLLEDIMKRLNIKNLIATEFDLSTGKMATKCRGAMKVVRYNEIYHEQMFDDYYYDSDHDRYLLKYARTGNRVLGDEQFRKEK